MEQQFTIAKNKLRASILEYLKSDKCSMAWWINECERKGAMDIPMLAVETIMDYKLQEFLDLQMQVQNITEAIEKIHFSHDKEENERKIEMAKHRFGLKSKYQPPTNFKFFEDGDDAIRNTIING